MGMQGRIRAKICGTAVAAASALVTTVASISEYSTNVKDDPPFLIYAAPPSMPVLPPSLICAPANDCSCRQLNVASSSPESSTHMTSLQRYGRQGSRSFTANVLPPLTSSSLKDTLPFNSRQTFLRPDMTTLGDGPLISCSNIPHVCSISSEIIRLSSLSFMHQSILSPTPSVFASSLFSINSWASSFKVSSGHSLAVSDYFLKFDEKVVYETLKKEQKSCERNADVDGKTLNPRSTKTVVILGWLGAQQKHLRRYAEWYRARGINAVTFVIPMRDILSLNIGSDINKSEQRIKHLAIQLATWLSEANHDGDQQHCLLFHTFSNTGWLTYGVILENLLERDCTLLNKVRGCVVDSAPAADLDPQVWASGFSAALLTKRSIPVQKIENEEAPTGIASVVDVRTREQPKAAFVEVALRIMLEKFFSNFLQLPFVKQRLAEVVNVLSKRQPDCPQLYIYSSADTVIPAKFVESFIDEQRKAGHQVEACNLLSSPHVDHFRSFPEVYSAQLSNFVRECLASSSQ